MGIVLTIGAASGWVCSAAVLLGFVHLPGPDYSMSESIFDSLFMETPMPVLYQGTWGSVHLQTLSCKTA